MILVDTSVWIQVLRDKSGKVAQVFRERVGDEIIVLCRFTQLELLQGARNETEWRKLNTYLSTQYYLEASETTWERAARIYFDLRKKGITVRSPIDCCIAQIAIEFGVLLLHQDRDFERIAQIRVLIQEFFENGS
ncbi:PIN domain nuclease [Thermodesulfobacteriota bacterium]